MNELTLGVILSWIIFGLVIGLLARLIVPGRDPLGWLGTIFLGIIGSFVGGLIAFVLRLGTQPFAPAGWILSIIGAVVALLLYYQLGRRRRGTI